MREAQRVAQSFSLDPEHQTGAVLIKKKECLGIGANGSHWHEKHGCERKRLGIATGQGYELCEGCHPKNHAEQKAIRNTLANNGDTKGADLYLWGHWWCCEGCWEAMMAAGIDNVFLVEKANELFSGKRINFEEE
ncbi:hypothetical protein KAI58_02695 [Candidatus Gracilibacteria bacterium]|nr:hypothetical protein [Candidatus Gracilibacteria bacterium]